MPLESVGVNVTIRPAVKLRSKVIDTRSASGYEASCGMTKALLGIVVKV